VNVQITHIIVHTPEQVSGIIGEAIRIVTEAEIDGGLKKAAFEKACDLLGQRYTFVAQPTQVPLSLDGLKNLRAS
jgi:hypothetical protein